MNEATVTIGENPVFSTLNLKTVEVELYTGRKVVLRDLASQEAEWADDLAGKPDKGPYRRAIMAIVSIDGQVLPPVGRAAQQIQWRQERITYGERDQIALEFNRHFGMPLGLLTQAEMLNLKNASAAAASQPIS